jgi:hypothetical protein
MTSHSERRVERWQKEREGGAHKHGEQVPVPHPRRCGWCMSHGPSSTLCRTPVGFRICRFMPNFDGSALWIFYKKKKGGGGGNQHMRKRKGADQGVWVLRMRDGASNVADMVGDVTARGDVGRLVACPRVVVLVIREGSWQ